MRLLLPLLASLQACASAPSNAVPAIQYSVQESRAVVLDDGSPAMRATITNTGQRRFCASAEDLGGGGAADGVTVYRNGVEPINAHFVSRDRPPGYARVAIVQPGETAEISFSLNDRFTLDPGSAYRFELNLPLFSCEPVFDGKATAIPASYHVRTIDDGRLNRISGTVLSKLEARFPGLAGQIVIATISAKTEAGKGE